MLKSPHKPSELSLVNPQNLNDTNISLNTFKVLTLGETNVGKTSLISNYCDDNYKLSSNGLSTVGIDVKVRKHHDEGFKMIFYDTAGQERFRNIPSSYYKSADVILFTFSLTSYESFFALRGWVNTLSDQKTKQSVIKLLVGTKSDLLSEIEVSESEITKFAEDHDLNYYMVSNKTKKGIEESYEFIQNKIANIKIDEEYAFIERNSFLISYKKKIKDKKLANCCFN